MIDRRQMLLASLAAVAGCGGCRRPAPAERPLRLALLVGVTDYAPGLPWKPLAGPANDVELWRSVLTGRHGFTDDGIIPLTSATTPPTRANIRREFERLAADAQPGGHVFILLAGHGTGQPDQVPADPDDPEPDGMDQVFLPSDARAPDPATRTIPNGIIDDELRVWLRAIAATGARVWLVFDCCHAGTMLRAEDEDGVRGVPASRVWSAEVIEAARKNGGGVLRGGPPPSPLKVRADKGIVALYACRHDERTGEAFFPDIEAPDRRKLGVFTQALCTVLARTQGPLTCGDLVKRLPALYEGGPGARLRPTPFAEGDGLDAPLFGEPAPPSPFVLTRDGDGWSVDGGQLHGLMPGAVLAVEGGGKARILTSGLTTSRAAGDGADGAKARLAEAMAQARPVALAVGDVPGREAILKRLTGLKRVRVVPPQPDAWRLTNAGGLALIGPGSPGPRVPLRGAADLEAAVAKVVRVTNLLWLASDQPGADLGLELEIRKVAGEKAMTGQPIPPGERAHFGDWVRAVVHNRGKKAADVTLLAVDHQFGMASFLPDPKAPAPNRLPPGGELGTDSFLLEIDKDTPGPEVARIVMVAVEAEGEAATNFAWLADDRFDVARGPALSPLGRFLAGALFDQATRGVAAGARHQLAAQSWAIFPKG